MRPIVKDALKCDELVYQFFQIDHADCAILYDDKVINKFYADKYLIKKTCI
jgi:hypothetical protein